MSDTLVDSSAWIGFLRGDAAVTRAIDALLAKDRAAVCGPIVAEVLSGARDRRTFESLRTRFEGMKLLEEPNDAWHRSAETRWLLARKGLQASLIDILIAWTASDAAHRLLTLDRDFEAIAGVLPLEILHPQ